MQLTSIYSVPLGCCPNLKHHFPAHSNTHIAKPINTNHKTPTFILFCSSDQHLSQTQYQTDYPTTLNNTTIQTNLNARNKELFLEEMYSFFDDKNKNDNTYRDQTQETIEQIDSEVSKGKVHRGVSSNMWWQNLKATMSQRFNFEGISSALRVITREQSLALPHVSVKDIRWMDWVELEKRGFRGVVFDKDNTLTAPYSLSLWPTLESSLDSCKAVFGDNVAVFSNSAGLYQYDADGSKARVLENSIGIHVVRHGTKKPGGSAEDIEKYFGCSASLLLMVGDRHFTDMVYGNRNGFLTILTEPLTLVQEPFVVKQVRKLEASLARYWHRRGVKPIYHSLQSDAMQCVKLPPPP